LRPPYAIVADFGSEMRAASNTWGSPRMSNSMAILSTMLEFHRRTMNQSM
jgi:hypothetical protein